MLADGGPLGHDRHVLSDPTPISFQESALLLIGHGSTKNEDSVVSANFQADLLRQLGVFGDSRAAFWKVEPKIDDVLDSMSQKNVHVVPFFFE